MKKINAKSLEKIKNNYREIVGIIRDDLFLKKIDSKTTV